MGLHLGPIFKGRAVPMFLGCPTLEDFPSMFSRIVVHQTPTFEAYHSRREKASHFKDLTEACLIFQGRLKHLFCDPWTSGSKIVSSGAARLREYPDYGILKGRDI